MGWIYGGAWLFIGSYVTLGFGGYLQQVLSEFLHPAGGGSPVINTLFLILGMILVNLTGGRFFIHAQKLIVLLALVALVSIGVVGLSCAVLGFHSATLSRFSLTFPHGASGVLETASLAFLALSGFDIIATTGEEVKNPQRMLPLAIFCTLGIVLFLYLLVTAATAGVLSGSQLSTKTPLADAARQLFGGPGQQLIGITAVLTTAATGNALLAATSRITFAMARDGHLPRFLAYLHPSTGAPWVAIIVNGAIFALFALTTSIDVLAAIGSFLYELQFALPLVALICVRSRPTSSPSFRTPAPFLVLPLACAGCCLLLYASGQKSMSAGLAWLGAGLIIHLGIQGLRISLYRKRYLSKGYSAITKAIGPLREQIYYVLNDSEAHFERLEAAQGYTKELKHLRAIQARAEELEQQRASQTRIEELKHLRAIQARAEELELLRAIQVRIEELKLLRAAQVYNTELKFLQTTQVQFAKDGGTRFIENALSEIEKELPRGNA
jgi:APA family basic amino acid/polyamine antiporter